MEKSKLGIPVPVLAAVCGLLCVYGGYLIAGLLVGYVLLKEENLELKRTCAKFFAIMLAFSVASSLINLIPNLVELLRSLLWIFEEDMELGGFFNVFNFLGSVLNTVERWLLLILSVLALLGKSVKLPVLDDLMKKYIN